MPIDQLKITLKSGKKIRLTLEDARECYSELSKIFKNYSNESNNPFPPLPRVPSFIEDDHSGIGTRKEWQPIITC